MTMVTTQRRECGDHSRCEPEKIAAVRELMREYGDSLGVDLSYQNFEERTSIATRRICAAAGALLLALDGEEGCGLRGDSAAGGKILRNEAALRASGMALDGSREAAVHNRDRGSAAGGAPLHAAGHASLDDCGAKLYAALGFLPIAPYYRVLLPARLFFSSIPDKLGG